MGPEINKVWSGPIKDLPEKYIKEGIPEGCINVSIYNDGSRVYDRGLCLNDDQLQRLSQSMSRCWDSLTPDKKISINTIINNGK